MTSSSAYALSCRLSNQNSKEEKEEEKMAAENEVIGVHSVESWKELIQKGTESKKLVNTLQNTIKLYVFLQLYMCGLQTMYECL